MKNTVHYDNNSRIDVAKQVFNITFVYYSAH